MKKIYYFLFSILAVATTSCSDDLDINLSSTYKCNFLGADNKQ